jgi:hypothetical protein
LFICKLRFFKCLFTQAKRICERTRNKENMWVGVIRCDWLCSLSYVNDKTFCCVCVCVCVCVCELISLSLSTTHIHNPTQHKHRHKHKRTNKQMWTNLLMMFRTCNSSDIVCVKVVVLN